MRRKPTLIPITERGLSGLKLLAETVRKGWMTPPTLPATGEPPTPERVAPLSTLLGELDADRSER